MQLTDLESVKEPGQLTAKQIAVLDLLVKHQSTKEIARELGISPFTVDQRIKSARSKLGASSRSELARIYDGQRGICGESIYRFPDVAEPLVIPQIDCRDQLVEPVFKLSDVSQFQAAAPWHGTPIRPSGLEALDNRFGIAGRIGAICAVAATIAILLLAMLAVAETLSRLI